MTNQAKLKEYLIKEAKDFIANDDSIEMDNEEAEEIEKRTLKILDLL